MKKFDVPLVYRSSLITAIKNNRKQLDKLKKDFTPSFLDFGDVHIYLSRHFGFCYGVENAIEIAFKTISEHPNQRIFLLSEMIHNPQVNHDLKIKGVKFLMDTAGNTIIPFETLTPDDIVIVPAFGTTIAIEEALRAKGIEIQKYNTTCPFVEKVWNRAASIAKNNYSIIIHGKPSHEETRATFSHSAHSSPSVVIRDMQEAIQLGKYISEEKGKNDFYREFDGQYSTGFNIETDLERIGVVNQTTMLANDTQAIADYLKKIMAEKYGLSDENIQERFADTRDTLCYATYENQSAVYSMLETPADLAIVVGGYNSSNTSHLAELCEERVDTFFIHSEDDINAKNEIHHYNLHTKQIIYADKFLPEKTPLKILLTSGASCPDALVEAVINKILSFFKNVKSADDILAELN